MRMARHIRPTHLVECPYCGRAPGIYERQEGRAVQLSVGCCGPFLKVQNPFNLALEWANFCKPIVERLDKKRKESFRRQKDGWIEQLKDRYGPEWEAHLTDGKL